MDDHAERTGTSLYERDFYAWTQQQAALIREGQLAAADLPNLVEEIETLGRQEFAELRSRLRVLLAHLLKEMYQPAKSSRSWKTTILQQRIAIADLIADNPSLKPRLVEGFAKGYADARDLASAETGLPSDTFPDEAPFSFEEAVSRLWQPQPRA